MSSLEARARRAYELGRLRAGLARAAWLIPIVALSILWRGRPADALALGALVAAVVAAFHWAGGTLARAVVPGLVAGLPPVILPLLLRCCGNTACPEMAWDDPQLRVMAIACLASGAAAGAVVAWWASRLEEGRAGAAAAAGILAIAVGALGCSVIGTAGLAGLVAGLLVAGGPAVVLARRS
jgi:hypothetical protein